MIKNQFLKPKNFHKNPKNPLVSVVIPAYNEEKFIGKNLQSLAKQNFKNYEIIIVDNNSKDKTAKIAKRFGARVVYEPKKGVIFARQRGANEARGKIIVTTDADCTYNPDWLSSIYEAFNNDKGKNIIAVTGPFLFGPVPKWGRLYSKNLFRIVDRIYKVTGKILYVGASNFAFYRSIWKKVGGYNTKVAQGGDEIGLFKKFNGYGRTVYLNQNTVSTSSRRLSKGIIYSLFITLIGYYLLDYFIASKITGKSFFGQYPAIRENAKENDKGKYKSARIVFSVIAVFAIFTFVFVYKTQIAKAEVRNVALKSKKVAAYIGHHFQGRISNSVIYEGRFYKNQFLRHE